MPSPCCAAAHAFVIEDALLVLIWSQAAADHVDLAEVATLAQALALPVRVLLSDAARLPEDAFLDVPDLQVAIVPVHDGAGAFRQVRRWLEEVA